jgi:hypothetical protein
MGSNPFDSALGGGGGGSGGGGYLPVAPAPKPKQETAAQRRTPEYSEKQLVRLLGRLTSTKQLDEDQKSKVQYLLTGFKPEKVRKLAESASLPEATTLELVDYARRAQGMDPLPEIAAREQKLRAIVAPYAEAEPQWETKHPGEDPAATGSGGRTAAKP